MSSVPSIVSVDRISVVGDDRHADNMGPRKTEPGVPSHTRPVAVSRRRSSRAVFAAWEQRKRELGEPVWAHPSFPGRPWIAQIAKETGLLDTSLSDRRAPGHKLIADAVARLGLQVKLPEPAPLLGNFDEFIALAAVARDRAMQADGKSDAQRKTATQTFKSYLKRAARSVAPGDKGAPAEIIAAAITLAEAQETRDRKYVAELKKALELKDAISKQHDLPPAFDGALSVLVRKSGRSARELAITVGITQQVIQRWMSGERAPSAEAEGTVERLEKEFGVPKGTLLSRIQRRERKRPSSVAARAKSTGPLAPDECARLSRRRNAFTFKPEWLNARKAKLTVRAPDSAWPVQLGTETFDYLSYRTVKRVRYPIVRDSGAIGDDSAHMHEQALGKLFAFFCDPRNPAFRIERDELSMAFLVFPQLVDHHLHHQASRRRSEAQPLILGHDIAAVGQWRMLTKPKAGFLAQNPSWRERLRPVYGPDGSVLVSPAEVAAAQADWAAACSHAHEHYDFIIADWNKDAERSLDPHHRISAILELDEPRVAFRLGMVGLQTECAAIAPLCHAHATIIRDQVIWGLECQLVLRSTTLGAIAADGRMLSRRGEHWWIELPHGAFKNGDGPYFKGPKGGRCDFRRRLVDRDGLYAAIEAYLGWGRHMLLGARGRHDMLFVSETNGAPLGRDGVSQALRRTFERHVRYDPAAGTGIPGVHHTAATHWFRHVMATGVLKATWNLNLAAQAIHDTPETVLKHYSYLVARGGGDVSKIAAGY